MEWNCFQMIKLINKKCVEYLSIVYYESDGNNTFRMYQCVLTSIFDVICDFKSHTDSIFLIFIVHAELF